MSSISTNEGQYSRKTLQALCETSDRSGQDILLGTLDTLDENDIVGRSSSNKYLDVSLKSRIDLKVTYSLIELSDDLIISSILDICLALLSELEVCWGWSITVGEGRVVDSRVGQ